MIFKKYIKDSDKYISILDSGQCWKLMCWRVFNKKKFNEFVRCASIGMHARAAFKYADEI